MFTNGSVAGRITSRQPSFLINFLRSLHLNLNLNFPGSLSAATILRDELFQPVNTDTHTHTQCYRCSLPSLVNKLLQPGSMNFRQIVIRHIDDELLITHMNSKFQDRIAFAYR